MSARMGPNCNARWACALLFCASSALAGSPRASSELRDRDGQRHGVSLAFDGLLSTGWAEGAPGSGEGEWIELRFDRPTDVRSVSIWPGNLELGERSARENGRPHTVTVLAGAEGEPVSATARVLDPAAEGPLRVDVPVDAPGARWVKIELDQVVSGGLHDDTYIAEVAVNFSAGGDPPAVGRIEEWLSSDGGKREAERSREEVIALFKKITEAEFGDRDSLQELMARAGDGAPFVRRQVGSRVPAGFRVQALPPDQVAVEALLKLKDSNAIPAIEQAALRSRGAEARQLDLKAQMFRAYNDMVGGGRLNLPPWGSTGWELGALQGLGEPLALVVDPHVGIYVADTGNHRLQRFGFDGIVQKAWGGEADITQRWFQSTREFWASGAVPGEAPGQFVSPVDVVLLPGKEHNRVAVLDGAGRISILDGASDAVATVFQVAAEQPISPGVGGEGFLLLVRGKLVTIWGNEGVIHSLDGEELGRFSIEDGVPGGAVALGGKLGLAFGKQLVLYSLDGFRHGDVMAGALGEGFESWDPTLDERGRLWVVTDQGKAYKFKRPGKVDFEVRITPYSLTVPRAAVFDGVLYVTHDDAILRIDALELAAQAELEAVEGAAGEPE